MLFKPQGKSGSATQPVVVSIYHAQLCQSMKEIIRETGHRTAAQVDVRQSREGFEPFSSDCGHQTVRCVQFLELHVFNVEVKAFES